MKRLLVLLILWSALFVTAEAKHYQRPGAANVDFFYSSLSPYGEWVDCNLGYVWRPFHVAHGWRPYLNGRWMWTDYGWYWVSNEPFGWATFHYGRWEYDDYYGWIWIPDNVWGPAWVEWRYDDDYVGWAPLSLYATFNVNVGITFTHQWVAPYHYWNFVPCRNFASERIVDYVQPIEKTRRIFGNTRGVVDIRSDNDRIVNRGVDVNFIERRGNLRITRTDVVTREHGEGDRVIREANRERVEVFRPRLDNQTRNGSIEPPSVRHAERPVGNDAGRYFNTDHHEQKRSRDAEREPMRVPQRRSDAPLQEYERRNQRQPEHGVEAPRRIEREQSRGQESKESRQRDYYRGRIDQQQPRERIQESRGPEQRREFSPPPHQPREASREQGKGRQDNPRQRRPE